MFVPLLAFVSWSNGGQDRSWKMIKVLMDVVQCVSLSMCVFVIIG